MDYNPIYSGKKLRYTAHIEPKDKPMTCNVEFSLFPNGQGFNALCNNRKIGEITFVRVADKMIIDHTAVDAEFRNENVGLNLVRQVCNLARMNHRKILALCPFAQAMFNRYPEFDDVRLINAH